MERENIYKIIKKILSIVTMDILYLVILFLAYPIVLLHQIVSFFPILFLFDLFFFSHPLFFRVFKRECFKDSKNDCFRIKYIALPLLLMELAVVLYYPQETNQAIDILSEGKFLK